MTQVLEITIHKRLLDIETQSDNVARILHAVRQRLLKRQVILEQGLFVVRQHEDQGHIKDLLQPSCELEGDRVAQVEAAGAGSATRVQEKGLAVLVLCEDLVKVAMAEEEASSEPAVRLPARHSLEPLEEFLVDD